MGLLDDAIREHLELKRRHGADPGEVERQEREALGATPRAGEFAPAEEPEEQAAAADDGEPRDADEPVAEAAEPTDAGEEREPFDVEAVEPAPGADAEPWPEEEQPDEVPAGESLARPRDEPEEPAEDLLEDTPDFLQETPEHDRLWFEQRPPRDFDWDK